jgi:phosphatidate cytidylyltransferase
LPGGGELGRRLIGATLLIGLVAAALVADALLFKRDVGVHVLLLVGTALAYNEFCNLCESREIRPFRVFGIVGCLMLVILHWFSMPHWRTLAAGNSAPLLAESYSLAHSLVDGAFIALIMVMFLRQAFIRDSGDALPAVGTSLLGVLYVWFLPSFLIRIRNLGGAEWLITGQNLMIATIVVAKSADVGAYLFGRKLGRHKLIPRISPSKSLEGAFFGMASSVGAAFLMRWWGLLPEFGPAGVRAFGIAETLAFGLLVGLTGMCGDLFESILKRSGRTKDSSRMLPGYGGVLDVLDSVIMSAPPAYLFLRMVAGFTMGGAG